MLSTLKEGILRGCTSFMSFVVFQEYVGGFTRCSGPSMKPTIFTNDILLTDQVSPRLGMVKVGDVVIARSPENYQCICKRVVAQAGDLVTYKGQTIKIPKGHLWLEGDNKDDSHDSRNWGPLPVTLLRRKCVMKIWPLFDISMLGSEGKVYAEAAVRLHAKN